MFETGMVVLSLSGHDKGKLYAVVRVENGFCYIADGGRRKLQRPKKKNPRHLRATKKTVRLDAITSDKALRRTLASLCDLSTREESCICPSKMS